MSELALETTPGKLKMRIETLPQLDLKHVLGLITERLNNQSDQRREIARRVLTWLAFAERPLTPLELQQAVAIEPYEETGKYNPDAALNRDNLSPTELFEEVCGGLIAIDAKRGTALPTHASIMYHLREFRDSLFPMGREYIARCVLSFLRNHHVAAGATSVAEKFVERNGDVPLLAYVSRFWGYHLNDLPVEAMGVARDILDSPRQREALCKMLYASDDAMDYPLDFGPVHFVAYFNMDQRMYAFESKQVDVCDSWKQSPLHIACQRAGNRFTDILRWSNQLAGQDRRGKTPLHYAAINNSTTIAKALLERLKPREIEVRDRDDEDGRTPLDYAAQSGNLELVRTMHERLGGSVSHNNNNNNGLWLAASNGHKDVVEYLLNYHSKDDDAGGGDRALFEASKNGHYDVAELLIQSGVAEPTFTDPAGITALHHTSYARNLELARLLILEGADIDATDKNGQSPLCRASAGGDNPAIIKLLVGIGADIDKRDDSGRSALDTAAENGHLEALRYLLRHGARTNSSDLSSSGSPSCHENTAAAAANPKGNPRMNPLQISCKLGFESNVVVLLEESAISPDSTAGVLRTPLSLACEGGHAGIVKLLLATGRVNINSLDENRRTPLSYAVQRGHAKVVKLLFADAYINLGMRNRGGRTALSYAAEAGPGRATWRLLLHYSLLLSASPAGLVAALSAEDDEGKTPVDYAAGHKGLYDYMRWLLTSATSR